MMHQLDDRLERKEGEALALTPLVSPQAAITEESSTASSPQRPWSSSARTPCVDHALDVAHRHIQAEPVVAFAARSAPLGQCKLDRTDVVQRQSTHAKRWTSSGPGSRCRRGTARQPYCVLRGEQMVQAEVRVGQHVAAEEVQETRGRPHVLGWGLSAHQRILPQRNTQGAARAHATRSCRSVGACPLLTSTVKHLYYEDTGGSGPPSCSATAPDGPRDVRPAGRRAEGRVPLHHLGRARLRRHARHGNRSRTTTRPPTASRSSTTSGSTAPSGRVCRRAASSAFVPRSPTPDRVRALVLIDTQAGHRGRSGCARVRRAARRVGDERTANVQDVVAGLIPGQASTGRRGSRSGTRRRAPTSRCRSAASWAATT